MPAPESETVGYAITLEVTVPLRLAEQAVDRLDAVWHVESWTPEGAAFVTVQNALKAAGLDHAVLVSTRAVNAGEPRSR
jgi:hypothetical protein